MSLFNRIFSSSEKETTAFPWIPLQDAGQLEDLKMASRSQPQIVFKHSTSCGLSSMILRRFEQSQLQAGVAADYYYLDLIRFRELSNTIAEMFEVRHQSPQLLIIRDGKLRAHASHSAVLDLSTEQE
ncbi:bacillithiol system redox-active protein YtxJ [Robiginitalea sp. IMCC43444]|uniref:bacillithiol system redox-active protein YtxJ n=1 Tax=Robiginitalea sp. IMCC43444 TaxID=3459121 RepID=UPI0040420284